MKRRDTGHSKRCIFCKQDSSMSRTVEHIIPEALGNKEHILPAGVVCDSCNEYFALKIEKPLLELDYFRHARFRKMVPNKEDRIPTIQAVYLPGNMLVEIMRNEEGTSIYPFKEANSSQFVRSMLTHDTGSLIIPEPALPDEQIVSRFLGKVAIEVLAFRLLGVPGGLEEIVDKPELDKLRHYVRFGDPRMQWPFHRRRLYHEDKVFYEEGYGQYDVLHEFDLLYTESQELYLVLAIFGIEYCLNMGGPEIDGYVEWLKKHEFKSPLYKEIIQE